MKDNFKDNFNYIDNSLKLQSNNRDHQVIATKSSKIKFVNIAQLKVFEKMLNSTVSRVSNIP